jgi:hypothetical protein
MEKPKNRGGLITVWLCLMLLSNITVALIYLLLIPLIPTSASTLGISAWVFYALGALSAVNVIFTILMFRWKRIGFFGICGMAVIAFAINVYMNVGINSLVGLAGPVILWLIIRPKWKLFE